MKKRILVLLLTLALLAFGVVFAAFAAEEGGEVTETPAYTGIEAEDCPCGAEDCNRKIGDLLNESSMLYAANGYGTGHYKLSGGGPGSPTKINDGATVVIYAKNVTFGKDGSVTTKAFSHLDIGQNCTVYIYGNGATIRTGFAKLVTTNADTGASTTTLADGGAINIDTGSTVTIKNMNICAGPTSTSACGNGGLIYNAGTLNLINTTVNATRTSTNAVASAGGAIYNVGTLSIDNCTVTGANVTGDGGAIYNAGTLTVNGGTITAGSINTTNGKGGAVMSKAATTEITGTTMTSAGTAWRGGLIYQDGGTVKIDNANMDVSAMTSVGRGGAIYLGSGTMNITGSTIVGSSVATHGGCFTAAGTMTVKDSTLSGGQASTWGGNIFVAGNTTTLEGTTVSGGKCATGGNIMVYAGTVIIKNSANNDALIENGEGTQGGNIHVQNTGVVKFQGGTITGGNSEKADALTKDTVLGGNVYTKKANGFVMTGGTVSNGTAYKGGNLYLAATTTISGGTISGGSSNQGGNIFVASTVTLSNVTVDGTDGDVVNGGNIYMYSGTLNLDDGAVLKNGTANNGGNIFIGNTTKDDASTTDKNEAVRATLNIKPGSEIIDGTSSNYGGNIYTSNNVTINMTGGEISGGQGDVDNTKHKVFDGDNVYLVAGNTMTMTGGVIKPIRETRTFVDKDGKESTASVVGNGVWCNGAATLVLGGDAEIINESKFGGVYIPSAGFLTIQEGFSGNVCAYIEGHATGYGTDFDADIACTGAFTGNVFVESTSSMGIVSKSEPAVIRKGETTTLTVGAARVVSEEGTTWYASNADAIAAAAQDTAEAAKKTYVTVYTTEAVETPAQKFVTVDFNGKVVAVTNNGTLFAADTSSYWDSGDKAWVDGTAVITVTGTGTVAPAAYGVDGNYTFVALPGENDTYTIASAELRIKSVSLRAKDEGLYYTAAIEDMTPALKELVDVCGVAVTVAENADTSSLDNFLYTNDKNKAGAYTGVLVMNILRDATQKNAETKVYARAYIQLKDGTIIMSEAADYSLLDVVNAIAPQYYGLKPGQKADYDGLYDKMKDIVTLAERVTVDPSKKEEEI